MLKRGYIRSGHAFAVLKRGYTRRVVIVKRGEMHSLRYAPAILCSVFPTAAINI